MEQSRANWSARDTPGRTDQVLRARRAARQAGRHHTLHAGPPSGRSRAAHVFWAFASMRSEERKDPPHSPCGRGPCPKWARAKSSAHQCDSSSAPSRQAGPLLRLGQEAGALARSLVSGVTASNAKDA
jgi:hypothetical protein